MRARRARLAVPGIALALTAALAAAVLLAAPGGAVAEEACGYSACHDGAPVPDGGYDTPAPPAKAATSVSISCSTASVVKPKPFVLSGVLSPAGVGAPCSVYVKKPGKAYWSYSSARLTYADAGDGGAKWWYRYTPSGTTCPRGTYCFKVSFAGDDTHEACTSATIAKVAVR